MRASNCWLRVGLGEALLEVRDEGIGIAPDMLGSIFEMFVQGGRSKSWRLAAWGWGWESRARSWSCMAAASRRRATVRASAARSGLPCHAGPPALRCPCPQAFGRREAASPGALESPRRILLVDDNADAADSMGELLRVSGHEVLVAYGPIEALASAQAFCSEVAVLDIGLQTMDGCELAQELRVRLGTGAPAMIALSGYGQERDQASDRSSADLPLTS